MSVKESLSLDLDDLVDSPPSDDPLDFLRCECFGIGFSEFDSVPLFEPRRRRELRELPPSWAAESPVGPDGRSRLELFSEFLRAEEESKDEEESAEVWRFDLGARFAFCPSNSPDSIQKYDFHYQLRLTILRKFYNIQKPPAF